MMLVIAPYRYFRCPKGTASRYCILVFDSAGKPFMPLTDFYDHEKGRIAESSALNYLNILLPFFRWLDRFSNYKGVRIVWDMEPEVIRIAVKDYLTEEMYCKVRPLNSFELIKLTQKSPNTINRFLVALKNFYRTMIRLKEYLNSNPLINSSPLQSEAIEFIEGHRLGMPRMPAVAGTERPLRPISRRQTDSFFKIIDEEWNPVIIDDPSLPSQVYKGGEKARWRLRDEIITRLLFETGARATEVIELTIGDFRVRRSIREIATFNKGSNGRRTKYLLFSNDTYILLMRYLKGDRKKKDVNGLTIDELSDDAPLFLTDRGTAYTYHAWYAHWQKAIVTAGLELNPHKARHWYVTNVMRTLYETSMTESERAIRLKEFVRYMKWKSKETLEAYEHFFNEKEQVKLMDQVYKNMKETEKEYTEHRKRKAPSSSTERLNLKEIVIEDNEILDFFEGLEV
jgi:integrase